MECATGSTHLHASHVCHAAEQQTAECEIDLRRAYRTALCFPGDTWPVYAPTDSWEKATEHIAPLSWVDAEAGLLDTRKQGLYRWRKIIHLWIDGITFGDGPLVPRDDPAAAQIIGAVRLRDSAIAHRDGVSLARQRADLHATVQGAVVGALRWAINPSDLTPEDEETGQVGDDSWTIVRHALPFRVYGDGPLDFFRHHHAF